VLPPPATFDAGVFAVAATVHLVLSAAYGIGTAIVVAAAPRIPPMVSGATFGAALFAVNMYGFTMVFPWFAVVRDWITLVAHLAFGITAAVVYRAITRRA
jgi:uncharacterized membrane protein YagU involved in acid resistance